jgi:hypothetical protein
MLRVVIGSHDVYGGAVVWGGIGARVGDEVDASGDGGSNVSDVVLQ